MAVNEGMKTEHPTPQPGAEPAAQAVAAQAALSATDSWPKRFAGWASERFPVAQVVLLLPMFVAALLVGRSTSGGHGVALGPVDLAGFLAFWSFFLVLRVFDEHKDYELDCLNHPQRVLQRGLVTLGQLRRVAVVSVALQVVVGVAYTALDSNAAVLAAWAAAFVWGLLMAKEFFIHDWLAPRLVPYALSHMVIMPMLVFWVVTMGAGRAAITVPVALFAFLSLLSGLTFEVSRKVKAPEEERETVDSYTKVWGTRGAPAVVVGLVVAASVLLVATATSLAAHLVAVWAAAGIVLAVVGAAPSIAFIRQPAAGGGKKLETGTALFTLGTYAVVIAATLVHAGGLRWN